MRVVCGRTRFPEFDPEHFSSRFGRFVALLSKEFGDFLGGVLEVGFRGDVVAVEDAPVL